MFNINKAIEVATASITSAWKHKGGNIYFRKYGEGIHGELGDTGVYNSLRLLL